MVLNGIDVDLIGKLLAGHKPEGELDDKIKAVFEPAKARLELLKRKGYLPAQTGPAMRRFVIDTIARLGKNKAQPGAISVT